jgi:hypothetical protein
MTLNLERLSLTETVHTSWLGERLRLRLMALLLTLEGKCSSRRAKSAHVGCHLPLSQVRWLEHLSFPFQCSSKSIYPAVKERSREKTQLPPEKTIFLYSSTRHISTLVSDRSHLVVHRVGGINIIDQPTDLFSIVLLRTSTGRSGDHKDLEAWP